MGRLHILDICLLGGTSVAFILLAIGFSIPDWLYVTYRDWGGGDESSLHMSIWYNRLCPGDRSCITTLHRDMDRQLTKLNKPSYKEFVDAIITMTDSNLAWTAWQPLTTLSVTFSLIGLGFAIVVVCHLQSSKVRYHEVLAILGCFVMLATSALMWIPVIMMAVQHKDLDSDLVRIDTLLASISSANIRVGLHSPSGLIVSAIGAFLALLNAFVFLLSLLRRPTREQQVKKLKGEEVLMERERKPTYQCERKSTANALDITLLVFCSLALLTLIVGFLLPDWLYIRYKDGASQVSTLRMSIWYSILCPTNRETCEGVSYGSLDKKLIDMNNPGYKAFVDSIIYYTDGDLFWKTWQVLATIAVVMAFIGLLVAICLVCYVRHYSCKRLKLVIVLGCVLMMTASILMWLPLAILTTINLHLQSDLTAINTDLSTTTNRGTVALFTPSGLIVTAVGDLITFIAAMLFLVYLCRPQPQEREGYRNNVTESVDYLDLTDSNQVQCVLQPDDRSKFMAGPYLVHYTYIPQPEYSVQPVPVYTPQPLVKYVPRSHVLEDYMQTPTFGMSYAISNPMHLPYPRLHTGTQHRQPWYFGYYDGFSYA